MEGCRNCSKGNLVLLIYDRAIKYLQVDTYLCCLFLSFCFPTRFPRFLGSHNFCKWFLPHFVGISVLPCTRAFFFTLITSSLCYSLLPPNYNSLLHTIYHYFQISFSSATSQLLREQLIFVIW